MWEGGRERERWKGRRGEVEEMRGGRMDKERRDGGNEKEKQK